MSPTATDASVGPLERGLAVLGALARARGDRLRPSELVRVTGLARSPVDRNAATLLRLGYVREEDGRIMQADITVGTRFPAHATSMGRVLLAGLPSQRRSAWLAEPPARLTPHTVIDAARLEAVLAETGREGFALVDQELDEGLRSVAVPLRDPDGQVVAAVNVSLNAGRTSLEAVPGLVLPALREAAERISKDISFAFAFRSSNPAT